MDYLSRREHYLTMAFFCLSSPNNQTDTATMTHQWSSNPYDFMGKNHYKDPYNDLWLVFNAFVDVGMRGCCGTTMSAPGEMTCDVHGSAADNQTPSWTFRTTASSTMATATNLPTQPISQHPFRNIKSRGQTWNFLNTWYRNDNGFIKPPPFILNIWLRNTNKI